MDSSRAACALLSYFHSKGQFLHGVYYCVISDEDRKRFPELGEAYAIAVEALSSTRTGHAQYWLFATEAEYDDEVLLTISGIHQLNLDKLRQ